MRKELLKLSASAPNWWKMPETSVEAAERFDTKHRARSARADQLCILSRKATSPRDALALKFDEALFAVRTNRYFELRAVAPAEKVIPRARRPKEGKVIEPKPFDVYKSIWEPRRKDADSRDVYDTDEVEFNRFSIDWEELLRLGITKLILMHDDGGDDGVEDEDGDGIPDEVEDVGMVLWKIHDVLSSIYTYYSIQSGSISDGIGLNAWTDFTDDFNLVSKTSQFCQRKDVDLIFIEVNAKSKLAAREIKKQPSTRELAVDGGGELSLSRLEFYQALVRLAICKYVKGGEIPDVSDAVERLVSTDIMNRAIALEMVVVDTRTEIGKRRDAMIQFQGFMEALCRASTLKALPTAAELKAAGCDNAPQWIEENHDKYMAILSTRGTPWGIDPVRPVEESLQMVLDIVHHAVAKTTSSAQAGDISVRSRVVSTEQAMRFVTKLKGRG
ncbi:flagellar associated protein [Chrysochromulina tobinii]|uniref:Flagellar associated protein n=1 Tax=Chrysochromulina tobinii TaxID=1460289 RepID=A0A0M0JAT5_9EUKA|nr:flagellar associated protein [Chrysochromulina tobinii]|eukprot:KOO23709.1 flagellar associated protein [Chrysochromulina sp. CCMP291]